MSDVDTAPHLAARGAGDLPDEAFRLLVDSTAAPFVVIDRFGTILYAGASIEPVLGFDPAGLVGRNMVEFLDEAHAGLAIEAIAEIDTINRAGDGVPISLPVVRPDGTSTWVEVGAMPFLDMPGLDAIALRLRPWEAQHHLSEFLTSLVDNASLDDVLGHLSRSVAAAVGANDAVIHHGFDGRSFVGATGSWPGAAALPLDASPWTDVAVSGEARALDAELLPSPPGAAACWLLPVPGGDDVPPAVLTLWRDRPGEPLLGHRHVLERQGRFVRLALVRTAEHQRLRHLAGHDPLTGVANRDSFRDRLAQALAIGERDLAVAFCDLDRFKPVNDTWGHRTGDDVLVQVVARLREELRVGDELARIGGDEFTVLLREVPDATAAGQVANRLLAAVERPFDVPGGTVDIGISVGVALAGPGATADSLLATADAALYACKRAGGGRSAVVG